MFVYLLWNDALIKAVECRILDNVEGTDPGGYCPLDVMSLRGTVLGWCCAWRLLPLKATLLERYCPWKVLPLRSIVLERFCPWKELSLEGTLLEMLYPWEVLSLECAVRVCYSPWTVRPPESLFLECSEGNPGRIVCLMSLPMISCFPTDVPLPAAVIRCTSVTPTSSNPTHTFFPHSYTKVLTTLT